LIGPQKGLLNHTPANLHQNHSCHPERSLLSVTQQAEHLTEDPPQVPTLDHQIDHAVLE